MTLKYIWVNFYYISQISKCLIDNHFFLSHLSRTLHKLVLAITSGGRKYHPSTIHEHTDGHRERPPYCLNFFSHEMGMIM